MNILKSLNKIEKSINLLKRENYRYICKEKRYVDPGTPGAKQGPRGGSYIETTGEKVKGDKGKGNEKKEKKIKTPEQRQIEAQKEIENPKYDIEIQKYDNDERKKKNNQLYNKGLNLREKIKKIIPDIDKYDPWEMKYLTMDIVKKVGWDHPVSKEIIDISDYGPKSTAFVESGIFNVEKPIATIGWRYGYVPENGKSYNFRDQKLEPGVSFMQVRGGKVSGGFAGTGHALRGSPIIYGIGYLSNHTGSDDEPLLTAVKTIKVSKQ